MDNLITSEQLYNYLLILRSTIQNFNYSNLNNVIFFNIKSLYDFMSKVPCGDCTVKDILDKIDNYIPLGISDEAMELFVKSAVEIDYDKKNKLLSLFACRCRMDFLNLIKYTTSHYEWEKIINACEELRNQKITCENYYY